MSTLHPWTQAAKMAKRIRAPAPTIPKWKIVTGDKVFGMRERILIARSKFLLAKTPDNKAQFNVLFGGKTWLP
jgi:hypothetical protein